MENLAPIIVVTGNSGAGKDTVTLLLEGLINSRLRKASFTFKFSGAMKRTLEGLYHLEPGQLESRKFRQQPVPGISKTYLDVLIDFYFAVQDIDPLLMVRPAIARAKNGLAYGYLAIFNDLRTIYEAEAVRALAVETDTPLHILQVLRAGAEPLPSDQQQATCIEILRGTKASPDGLAQPHEVTLDIIENNGTIQDLQSVVEKLPIWPA